MRKSMLILIALSAGFLCGGCWGFGGSGAGSTNTLADPSSPSTSPAFPAAAAVEQAYGDAPEVVEVRQLWKGLACSNPEEAERRLSALLASDAKQPLALALRGLARSEMGQREAAFEDMTQAVRLRPTPEMYVWRGLVLWRNASPRGAEHDARYALRKSPKDALALMVLGLALKEQGKEAEACTALVEACRGNQCFGQEVAQKEGLCK